jgi:ABC-2 type transport system ATP-binding protein
VLDDADPGRDAITSFALHTATLDDAFLALTGRAVAGEQPEPSHA